ncbi:hypothetical protein, partial [Spirosoma areae]
MAEGTDTVSTSGCFNQSNKINTVRRQMKVDKRGENGKREFSKLFHSNHLGYVQFNQKNRV